MKLNDAFALSSKNVTQYNYTKHLEKKSFPNQKDSFQGFEWISSDSVSLPARRLSLNGHIGSISCLTSEFSTEALCQLSRISKNTNIIFVQHLHY